MMPPKNGGSPSHHLSSCLFADRRPGCAIDPERFQHRQFSFVSHAYSNDDNTNGMGHAAKAIQKLLITRAVLNTAHEARMYLDVIEPEFDQPLALRQPLPELLNTAMTAKF